jgi:glycosyltransferase involved in cell wall biosynthesis
MASGPLRIGINALYLIPGGVGGTEIYLRNLLGALAEIDGVNQYRVFLNHETNPSLVPTRPNFSCIRHPVPARIRPLRIVWEQAVLPLSALRHGLDVFLNPGFTAPLLTGAALVTVFHDLQHKRHPEFFRWFDLPFWRLFLWASAHRSHRLIAVSEATRADLERFYRLGREKTIVVPHGVGDKFHEIGAARANSTPEPFVLCVSTLHPHKNLDRLIEAFDEVRRVLPQYRLVIAGMPGHYARPVEALVRKRGLEDCVRFTGWIEREELYDLFRRAAMFVFPSRFEGFGMPVLEAMAAGIPTACSAIDPLKEVAGGAAVMFDPMDTRAIRDTIVKLLTDDALRAELAAAGPVQARKFTWELTAKQTLAAIVEAYRSTSSS